MCAQFALKIKANELSIKYGIKIPETLDLIDERFLPYRTAPVIVLKADILKLVPMQFSLVPSWSKESKVKFATHNARIETITEKPTWKIPFSRQHCVIPLTSFFESVYEGAEAGNIIEFKKEDENVLFAAGIFDRWINPESLSQLFSFSILTTVPTDYIMEHGHDRSPIFLDFNHAKDWLKNFSDEKNMIDYLLINNQKPTLKVNIDRPLKAGWEKRK